MHTMTTVLGIEVPSAIVGTCWRCGAQTLYGVCTHCHAAKACAWCGKVKQPDGTYLNIPHDRNRSSHGICPACRDQVVKQIPPTNHTDLLPTSNN